MYIKKILELYCCIKYLYPRVPVQVTEWKQINNFCFFEYLWVTGYCILKYALGTYVCTCVCTRNRVPGTVHAYVFLRLHRGDTGHHDVLVPGTNLVSEYTEPINHITCTDPTTCTTSFYARLIFPTLLVLLGPGQTTVLCFDFLSVFQRIVGVIDPFLFSFHHD